jgi:glycosyltransferase involved in cell wall biosynthesis
LNILFVHQGFPGQYIHLVRALARQGSHQLVALGIEAPNMPLPDGLTYIRYPISRGNGRDVHPLAAETETKVIRGEACAAAAHQLRQQGFVPDLICAHPGWGESLFLPDVWPSAPILSYQEFYYHPLGLDTDFDPELQKPPGWGACAKVRMKNAYLQLALESSRWNVTPTTFQRSTFPQHWQERISTIHDGIDCQLAAPAPERQPLNLADGTSVLPDEPVITFVNRRIEPTRGCHTLIRAIPELQRLLPRARLLVVGNPQGVSYGANCAQGDWKDQFLAEIEGRYDPTRVHFLGAVPYQHFLALLQRSDCHIYLTYPFVLSWSLLEAMACACPVVGSATGPVQEVIQDGHNGLLVDFFSPGDLATACAELLSNQKRARNLGAAARVTVQNHYSLQVCLPRQLSLMELVASGAIGR